MARAQNTELAKRINHAFTLLQKNKLQPQIVEQLMGKYGVSVNQAYRYIQLAREINQKMAIPNNKWFAANGYYSLSENYKSLNRKSL